jgi:hypothetical protein
MTLNDYIRSNPGLSDADAAAGYNAMPENYAPVPSNRVLAWLAEDARLRRLKAFAAIVSSDPQVIGLQSAVDTVLLAAGNPNTEVEVHPASGHRALLAALVGAGVLTPDDADALIARGKIIEADVTDGDVAAARAAIARQDAIAALRQAFAARYNAGAAAIEALATSDDPIPTIDDLWEAGA